MTAIENSVDCVIFGFKDRLLNVLLIERKQAPEKGTMALPGDFLLAEESLLHSAKKILKAITNLHDIFLEQIGAFGDTDRYPIKRVITIGFYALINIEHYKPQAGSTAERLEWCPIGNLPKLAFDHLQIIQAGYEILKCKIRREPIGFNLLPEQFSLTELQQVYEAILGTELNKRNFRTKLKQMKLLIETGIKQSNVAHKPAMLYRFDEKVYKNLSAEGFYFKL